MNRLIERCLFAISLLLPSLAMSQWTNLGLQSLPFEMTGDYRGVRFINTPGPTPSNGSVWQVRGTNDDWVTEDWRGTGGGGALGCCTVELLDFPEDSLGYMVLSDMGLRRVRRTTDGGFTWTNLAQGAATSMAHVADLRAMGDTVAYLIGHGPTAFSTLAQRWTPTGYTTVFSSSNHEGDQGRVLFVDENLGFVIARDSAGTHKVFRTTDGGANWSIRLQVAIGPLRAIQFLNPQVGFVAGEGGVAYKSTDGGFTWNSLAINGPVDVMSIDFLDEQTGYLACGGGIVLRTTDGGNIWSTDNLDSSSTLIYVKAVSQSIAYVLTSDTILYKRNYIVGEEEPWAAGSISIYPNPATEVFHLAAGEGDAVLNWRVLDLHGREMMHGNAAEIDVTGLPQGIYIVAAQTRRGHTRSILRVD